MKVQLAAQVLSSSVANALYTLEYDQKHPEFEGAGPTARFCQEINDIFDILNSRNLYNKNAGKHAVTVDNLDDLKIKIGIHIHYLRGLKLDGIPILQTNRKVGFLGLILDLLSIVKLAEILFREGRMTFLLTYKLSQDHLETFFSCVRRCGGFNNNPTARQFKSAYKKLLIHANVYIPLTGNCLPKDDTLLLSKNCISCVRDDTSNLETDEESFDDVYIKVLDSLCYNKPGSLFFN